IPRRQILWFATAVEGGLVVLALGLGWLLGRPAWHTLDWNVTDPLLGAAASLPLVACFLVCLRSPWRPFARIRELTDTVLRPLFGACTFYDLAFISLLAGVGEEALFRAVLQSAFGAWFGLWAGLVAASVLFGVLHLITPA